MRAAVSYELGWQDVPPAAGLDVLVCPPAARDGLGPVLRGTRSKW